MISKYVIFSVTFITKLLRKLNLTVGPLANTHKSLGNYDLVCCVVALFVFLYALAYFRFVLYTNTYIFKNAIRYGRYFIQYLRFKESQILIAFIHISETIF